MKKVVEEKWELEVAEGVKIQQHDTTNFTILQLTDGVNNVTKEKTSNWKIIGYYSTVRGALEGILHKDLLVDLDKVKTIEDYQNETHKAFKEIQKQLDGSK